MRRTTSITIDEDRLSKLDEIARRFNLSRSALVRYMIDFTWSRLDEFERFLLGTPTTITTESSSSSSTSTEDEELSIDVEVTYGCTDEEIENIILEACDGRLVWEKELRAIIVSKGCAVTYERLQHILRHLVWSVRLFEVAPRLFSTIDDWSEEEVVEAVKRVGWLRIPSSISGKPLFRVRRLYKRFLVWRVR